MWKKNEGIQNWSETSKITYSPIRASVELKFCWVKITYSPIEWGYFHDNSVFRILSPYILTHSSFPPHLRQNKVCKIKEKYSPHFHLPQSFFSPTWYATLTTSFHSQKVIPSHIIESKQSSYAKQKWHSNKREDIQVHKAIRRR